MKLHKLGSLLKAIKDKIVSNRQIEILQLMNIALYLLQNALTVLYINNEPEPKLKKRFNCSVLVL